MVDFKKQLGGKKSFAKPTDPIQIYETLDRASDKGPLRPAQKTILEEWHQGRRNVLHGFALCDAQCERVFPRVLDTACQPPQLLRSLLLPVGWLR